MELGENGNEQGSVRMDDRACGQQVVYFSKIEYTKVIQARLSNSLLFHDRPSWLGDPSPFPSPDIGYGHQRSDGQSNTARKLNNIC